MNKLWLPDKARPTQKCPICGKQFFRGEERSFDTHIRGCAEEHHDKIVAFRPDDPLAATDDTELEGWVRKEWERRGRPV